MAAAAGITADRSFASPQNVSQLRYAYQDPRSPGQKVIEARLILDNIFSYCSPGTIFRLAKSCRAAKRAADAYTRLAYDISCFLSPYFSPDCMRALRIFQATHGALIVGPSAYHFLNRSPDPGHELHIACRWGEATEIKQLLVSDGYISRGDAEWCYGCHFNKFTEDRELIARITLVQGHCPIWSMMKLQGDSSCMMNVITHSTAYCLFPRATFETGLTRSMGSISCTDSGSELPDELSIPLPEATPDTCPELFTPGYRSFSDSMAWRLPLNCKGLLVATSPHPDTEAIITDRLLGHSFSIPPSGACRKEIKLVTPRLEHVYSVGSERFHAAAEQFLTRLVLADPHRSGAVFDYEYVEFVRQCFIGRRTTDEISYQKVLWPTMKQMAPIPHETQTRAPLHCTACSTVQQYWWKSPGSPCLLHFPQGSPPSYKPITPRLHFQRPWPIPLDLLVQLEELDDDFEDA